MCRTRAQIDGLQVIEYWLVIQFWILQSEPIDYQIYNFNSDVGFGEDDFALAEINDLTSGSGNIWNWGSKLSIVSVKNCYLMLVILALIWMTNAGKMLKVHF